MRDSGRGIFKLGSDFSLLRSMKNDHGFKIFFFLLIRLAFSFFRKKLYLFLVIKVFFFRPKELRKRYEFG